MVVKELLGVLLFASALHGEDVRITTIPENFVMPREWVRITVYVPPNKDNRELSIAWAQDGGEQNSSRIQLDPTSPRQFTRIVKRLIPGVLRITAALERGGSVRLVFKEVEVK